MRAVIGILVLLVVGCGDASYDARQARRERAALVAPCQDQSVLLATTAGSPNTFTCPNQHHKMRVQVATSPSNEEAAALVFCECQKAEKEKR